MEELIESIKDILELDDLDLTKKFSDYEEWDSLSSLSMLALLDSKYHMSMTYKQILEFDSIEAFCKEVLSRQQTI